MIWHMAIVEVETGLKALRQRTYRERSDSTHKVAEVQCSRNPTSEPGRAHSADRTRVRTSVPHYTHSCRNVDRSQTTSTLVVKNCMSNKMSKYSYYCIDIKKNRIFFCSRDVLGKLFRRNRVSVQLRILRAIVKLGLLNVDSLF